MKQFAPTSWIVAWLMTLCGCISAASFSDVDLNGSTIALSPNEIIGDGGDVTAVTVVLRKKSGAPVTGVDVQLQAPGCSIAQPSAPTDANGVATAYITSTQPGSYTVKATVSAGDVPWPLTIQAALAVVPDALTGFAIQDLPATVSAGQDVSMAVTALGLRGAPFRMYLGTAILKTDDPNATVIPFYTFQVADAGSKLFQPALNMHTAGNRHINVSDSLNTSVQSSSAFTVVAGPPVQLALENIPSLTINKAVPVVVTVTDQFGNASAAATSNLHFTSNTHNASVPRDTQLTSADGGQFSTPTGLSFSAYGDYNFAVVDLDNPNLAAQQNVSVYAVTDLPKYGNGYSTTCAIINNGLLKCWGQNNQGQLGYGDTTARGAVLSQMGNALPFVNLGTNRHVVQVSVGYSHTCAVLDNGQLKCWGSNSAGELGLESIVALGQVPGDMGDNLPAVNLGTGRTAVAVAASTYETCALLDNQTVKCWGSNSESWCDLGVTNDCNPIGTNPETMGNYLPAINLGSGFNVAAITVGAGDPIAGNSKCAVSTTGQLKCWGRNWNGQLGYGNTNDYGTGPEQLAISTNVVVDVGTGLLTQKIIAGSYDMCGILSDNTLKCWGPNFSGSLGQANSSITSIGSNTAYSVAGALPIQLGTGLTAVRLAAGLNFACAVLNNGQVKCWGQESSNGDNPGNALDVPSGKLGQGQIKNVGDVANTMGNSLPPVALGTGLTAKFIFAGNQYVCVLLNDSTVKCWGYNHFGQLGLGDYETRGNAASQMGDNLPRVPLW